MKFSIPKIFNFFSKNIEHGITQSFSDVVIGKEQSALAGIVDFGIVKIRQFLKRFTDIFFSIIFLFIFMPFFAIIAVIIKTTSKGNIFFTQERVGYKGRIFKIYKFRTMRQDPSDQEHIHYVQSLLKENASSSSNTDLVSQYIEYIDERTTKVGRFLRATSLDELPQLINILLGQMSLVGPRPHPVYEVNAYKKWYSRRLEVKPGLTGWSKLNLRLTPKNYEEAILYDLWYVDNWSLMLDMRILIMTIPMVLVMKDAH